MVVVLLIAVFIVVFAMFSVESVTQCAPRKLGAIQRIHLPVINEGHKHIRMFLF
jgi:hypothetical protein